MLVPWLLARVRYVALEHKNSSFLQRAYDQLVEDICLQQLPVVFAIDRAGCVGADGETHHGMFDISYLNHIPGMTILTPMNGNQLESMMEYAFRLDQPCAIRYPRGVAVYDNDLPLTFDGKNTRIADGARGSIDIWAVGTMMECAMKVKDLLEEAGYQAGVVNVATVKPIDLTQVHEDCRLIITLEDNALAGGYGHEMAAALGKENMAIDMLHFGWPDEFIEHGSVGELMDKHGLTPSKIAERIREHIERKA